ncbi:hypothetical protein GC173_01735 [bacterium]|nr:hypothetical protein [bacterium]
MSFLRILVRVLVCGTLLVSASVCLSQTIADEVPPFSYDGPSVDPLPMLEVEEQWAGDQSLLGLSPGKAWSGTKSTESISCGDSDELGFFCTLPGCTDDFDGSFLGDDWRFSLSGPRVVSLTMEAPTFQAVLSLYNRSTGVTLAGGVTASAGGSVTVTMPLPPGNYGAVAYPRYIADVDYFTPYYMSLSCTEARITDLILTPTVGNCSAEITAPQYGQPVAVGLRYRVVGEETLDLRWLVYVNNVFVADTFLPETDPGTTFCDTVSESRTLPVGTSSVYSELYAVDPATGALVLMSSRTEQFTVTAPTVDFAPGVLQFLSSPAQPNSVLPLPFRPGQAVYPSVQVLAAGVTSALPLPEPVGGQVAALSVPVRFSFNGQTVGTATAIVTSQGGVATCQTPWIIPEDPASPGFVPRPFLLTVEVDSPNTHSETNEQNNVAIYDLLPPIDLSIANFRFLRDPNDLGTATPTPADGDLLYPEVYFNHTFPIAINGTMRAYLTDSTGSSAVQTSEVTVTAPAGTTATRAVGATPLVFRAGRSYLFQAFLDPDGAFIDPNRFNNFHSATYLIPNADQIPPVRIPVRTVSAGAPAGVARTADGRLTAVFGGGGVTLLSESEQGIARRLEGELRATVGAAFSPTGDRVAVATLRSGARIWELATNTVKKELSGNQDVSAIAWSRDGSRIAVGTDGGVLLLYSGTAPYGLLATLAPHTTRIRAIDFDPARSVVYTASDDGGLIAFDYVQGFSPFAKLVDPIGATALLPTSTGKLFACGRGGTVRCFDQQSGTELWSSAIGQLHPSTVGGAQFPSGAFSLQLGTTYLYAFLENGIVSRINVSNGTEVSHFAPTNITLLGVLDPQSDTGTFASLTGTVGRWNLATGVRIGGALLDQPGKLYGAAYAKGGAYFVAAGQDTNLNVWSTDDWTLKARLTGNQQPIVGVDAADSQPLAITTGLDGTVRLWDLDASTQIRSTSIPGYPSTPAFSPSADRFAVASNVASTGSIRVFNAATGASISTGTLDGPASGGAPAWRADGARLAVPLADGRVQIVLPAFGLNQALIPTPSGIAGAATYATYRADGNLLVGYATPGQPTLADYPIIEWNAITGQEIRRLGGNRIDVQGIELSADERRLMITDISGAITLRDFAAGTILANYRGHSAGSCLARFSPNKPTIASAGTDGQVLLWPNENSNRFEDKLLIVAATGERSNNGISAATVQLCDDAYRTALYVGYRPTNVRLLSAFPAARHRWMPDGTISLTTLDTSINDWASNARRLTILMIGHGNVVGFPIGDTSNWVFEMDGTTVPPRFISAQDFDAILDRAQGGVDPMKEIVLIMDSCYSGGFVKQLGQSTPADTRRLLFASTAADRLAYFDGFSGGLSFTSFLMNRLQNGSNYTEAFAAARTDLSSLARGTTPDGTRLPLQVPVKDLDGDGLSTGLDDELGRGYYFGSALGRGSIPPSILSVAPIPDVSAPQDVTLLVSLAPETPATSVTAWLYRDQDTYQEGQPIVAGQKIDLAPQVGSDRWQATIPASALSPNSSYTILTIATRNDVIASDRVDLQSNAVPATFAVGQPTTTTAPSGWMIK